MNPTAISRARHIELVNVTLDTFFEESIKEAELINDAYKQLWQNLHAVIKSGGKRVRPQMTLLAYDVFGGVDSNSIIQVAAAQELLHCSLLIHDDIIDRDYIRHGVPNIAGQYDTIYHPHVTDKAERTHYANSAALLGGDLLLSGAYQMIAIATIPDDKKILAQKILGQSIFEVAGGELLDTESAFRPNDFGDALQIARYKTASYSFIFPLQTGAVLAGASSEQLSALTSFGTALGIAYQLVDDLLGVFGDETKTGKSSSGDIREGKRTYLVEQCLERLSGKDRELFDLSFGDPDATITTIAKVKDLFISCGAKAATEQAIRQYETSARAALSQLSLAPEPQAEFEALIKKVVERTA